MSAERLFAAISKPDDEPLSPELQEWLCTGLRSMVLEKMPPLEALELHGAIGRADAANKVRRWIRNRIMAEVGECLEPGGSAYKQAAAIRDTWDGFRIAPNEKLRLDQANRLAPLPGHVENICRILRDQKACPQTPVLATWCQA